MHNRRLPPSGHEPVPSLLASRDAAVDASLEAAEQAEGILAVVSQGHALDTSRRMRIWRVLPIVSIVLVGALTWWIWPMQDRRVPALEAAPWSQQRAPQQPAAAAVLPDPFVRTTEAAVTNPSAARIELAEEVSTVPQPEVEPQASERVKVGQASSAPSTSSERRRKGSRVAPVSREPVRRMATRTVDPDVDVIEVLMSRAVPESVAPRQVSLGSGSTPGGAHSDVVLVQAGIPTAELVRRCLTLGWLEGQLCRARVCAARHDDEAACPRQATALGAP
ncbi:MAG: hypothetical protein KatS3mg122_3017 [Caldimonas sp.]|nr:MAG: hypothetical protein KatS3mg122_3017 [Caldimonas sp.]